ncbi:MAG: peptidoglycan DD-metalloendopeptidase family protein [Clostridiales bacterium]|nr:peptidoglycan DD-metalloendopeptidase family protein [Clostridiales bacterium]
MRNKIIRNRKIMALIAAAVTTFTAVMVQAGGESEKQKQLDSAKENVQQLKNQKKQAEELLKHMEEQKADLDTYIEEIDTRMTEIAECVYNLSKKIKEIEDKIDKNEEKLKVSEESRDKQQEDMKKRIRYIYENGESDYMELLLSGKSITEVLNRAEYISQISVYDRNMLANYQDTINECKKIEEELIKQKKSLQQMKEEEEDKLEAQQVLLKGKQQELANVNNSIKDSEKDVKQYKSEIAEEQAIALQLQNELEEIQRINKIAAELASKAAKEAEEKEAARKESIQQGKAEEERRIEESKAEEIRQQQAQQTLPSADNTEKDNNSNAGWQAGQNNTAEVIGGQNTPTSSISTTTVPTTQATVPPANTSKELQLAFCWPLPAGRTITSNFGPRPNQPVAGTALFHHGVDIYAPMGSEIVAAAAGTVVYVGNGSDIGTPGCGNQVWISHDGGRYMTMYNHCSALLVQVGQTVNAGSVIALVGSTGLSTGPHLDFRLYLTSSNAIYNKVSGDYLDPITGDYLNPNDMSGTRYPGASIQYYN